MNHDQNFKNLIIDYPLAALQLFAEPEAPVNYRGAKITPIRQEQLQQKLGENYRELDVPLLVEWPNGEREALLFALEEETQSSRFSIHRLAHYCLDLAQMYKTNRVVPVVIFLKTSNALTQLELGGDRHIYLSFNYLCCALAALNWRDYADSDNLVACLNLPNMKHKKSERIDVMACATRALGRLESDPKQQAKYLDFIDIYSNLSDNERKLYAKKYPKESSMTSNFAHRFEQQGLEKGLQQGMQQGMQQGKEQGVLQGEITMLLRLIESKFGKPNKNVKQRIEQADSQTLLQWSERILHAKVLEDIWH
jgi:hypothetical protein